MTNYRRGVRAEAKSKQWLEHMGYAVFRMAGSKSPVDLIALCRTHVELVQVKSGRAPRPVEVQAWQAEIDAIPLPPGTTVLIHYWPKGASEPEIIP